MVAFNFKIDFADLVADDIKRQTIREQGKRPGPRARVGQMLQLYTGQRSKQCYKLRPDVECVEVIKVLPVDPLRVFRIDNTIAGLEVGAEELALLDGFASVAAMRAFFPPGFRGFLYRWDVPVKDPRGGRWRYVYSSAVASGVRRRAASRREYYTRLAIDTLLPGPVGLMRGIPADWELCYE